MEDKFEKVELTSMCMISDGNGNILVQDRVKSWCGIAFPGGHVEKYESIVDSVVREVKEETGLTISHPRLCGIKQWFSENTRSVCFLFATETFEGEIARNERGYGMVGKTDGEFTECKNHRILGNILEL